MKKFYLISKKNETLRVFDSAYDLTVRIMGVDMTTVIIVVSVDGVDAIVPLQLIPNEMGKFQKFLEAYKESRRW